MLIAPAALRRSALPLTLIGLALACSAGPAAAASVAAGPPSFSPPGGVRSQQVAGAIRPDRTSEVTEFAADGGYRVTRCATDGRVLDTETVSPILGPDGVAVLVPTEREQQGVRVAM